MIEILLEAERQLSFGLLDQAEHLYRQAADADPRNSIAVVGLARVALERGDDARALELAERALGIDPDNEAARRLADRLREVAMYRGEPRGVALTTPIAADPELAPDLEPASLAPQPRAAGPPEPEVPARALQTAAAAEPESEPAVEPGPVVEPSAKPQPRGMGRILAWLRRLLARR